VSSSLVDSDLRVALWSLTKAMLWGLVLMSALQVVDAFFISLLGTQQLAAVAFCLPITGLSTSLLVGLGIGVTSAVARAAGSGDVQLVRRLIMAGLAAGLAVAAALAFTVWLLLEQIAGLLGATGAAATMFGAYLRPWTWALPFMACNAVCTAALRAMGNAKPTATTAMLAAAVNAVVDPLLIFGLGPIPAFGVAGAAYASVLGHTLAGAVAVVLLLRVKGLLDVQLMPNLAAFRGLCTVAVPVMVSRMILASGGGVITAIVATHGDAVVAACGVGGQLLGFVLIVPKSMSAGLAPIVGQNWGARRIDRVQEAVTIAQRFVTLWGAGAWCLLAAFAPVIAQLFSNDPRMVETLKYYLRVVPASLAPSAFIIVGGAALAAIARAYRSTLLSLLTALLLAIPLAFVGSAIGGVEGLLFGITLTPFVVTILASTWLSGDRLTATPLEFLRQLVGRPATPTRSDPRA
jgi:putative MATE family efflux protein